MPFDWLIQSNLSVWQGVRLVVLPDESYRTRKEPYLFFVNATDWTVWWTCPAKNASDWLIRRSAFSVFFGLLCRAISDSQTWLIIKTITRKRLLWVTNTPFRSVLDGKTDKTNVTLCYLLYPWWSIYTVHYARWWSLVSVCVCRWVVLNSTCSEYYD